MNALAGTTSGRHPLRGFTLLELVAVLVLLSVVIAIAVPSMRGFASASRGRDAVTQLVSVAQWAKARAATDATVLRLNVGGQSYWLTMQEGTGYAEIEADFGQVFALPQGMRIEVVPLPKSEINDASGIEFHPDGRTDTALLRLTGEDGRVTLIGCPSPAESFRVMTAEEAAQL